MAKHFYDQHKRLPIFNKLDCGGGYIYEQSAINLLSLLADSFVMAFLLPQGMSKGTSRPSTVKSITVKMGDCSATQYREGISGVWKDISGNSFDWSARNKMNRLEVRSVNEFGRAGPLTFLEVKYQ